MLSDGGKGKSAAAAEGQEKEVVGVGLVKVSHSQGPILYSLRYFSAQGYWI